MDVYPFCYDFLYKAIGDFLMKSDVVLRRFLALAEAMAVVIAYFIPSTVVSQSNLEGSQQEITIQNESLAIHYHRKNGSMDIVWRDGQKLLGITSAAQLEDGRQISTSTYTTHELDKAPHPPSTTTGQEYTIRSTSAGLPTILQHIWLHAGNPAIAIEAELEPKTGTIGTRHFDAVVLKGANSVQIEGSKSIRVLHVPFDNDMWFRYNSAAATDLKPEQLFTSEEVTAIYDNSSRHALILGSVTHDTWKTAIEAHAVDGQVTDLDIYGGISSPTGVRTDTHDTVPHGIVHGAHVVSPRIFIGSFSDWRDGLEAYGAANAAIHAPLKWAAGPPMGWNSWASYADKIDDKRYLGSAEFIRNKLVPLGFGNRKVVYINLDAFWSKLDAVQLSDAVATIKAMHGADGTRFEPGIYWTPFAYWSDDLDAYVEGTNMKYRYRDILLKAPDGSVLPKVDGGLAIDPSHPGARARASYYLQQFQKLGFQYLKIDFLSHGALEGVHFDPDIQTGIQAYNLGMKQVVDETGNRMFISLSIAPLFPSGYGHARRLSCDTKGHISGGDQSTEYMLNSLTYGWWTSKNLYITDPDHVVLGDKADLGSRSVVEGKSRLLSAIISGGMILDSSRLADDPQGQELAQAVYNNRSWMSVAAEGKTFRPIEGDTGDKAADVFVRSSAHGAYVAVFNYNEKHPQTITIPVDRIDKTLTATSSIAVINVASGTTLPPAHAGVSVKLSPSESTLLELRWK
jgi:alpha-galactosidase